MRWFYQLFLWIGMLFLLVGGGFAVIDGLLGNGTPEDYRGLGERGGLLIGPIFLYWFAKGVPLTRFSSAALEANSVALVITPLRGQTRTYKWSEIAREKERPFLQVYELFDAKGQCIVAVDYGIPCFSEFPRVVRHCMQQAHFYA